MGPNLPHPSNTARFTVKAATSTRGFVDGAWWPRSTDPTTEFASLLSAFTATSGPVTRFSYDLTAWEPAPRKLRVDGRQIRLEGFHTGDRYTVGLTEQNGHRVVLLVIPVETTESHGNAVLAAASDKDNGTSPHDLLAEDALSPDAAVIPQQTEVSPEARWETDGGYLRSPAPVRID